MIEVTFEGTTPRPWVLDEMGRIRPVADPPAGVRRPIIATVHSARDGALIVAVLNDLPELLRELEERGTAAEKYEALASRLADRCEELRSAALASAERLSEVAAEPGRQAPQVQLVEEKVG
jgi:hypothetical protein